MQDLYTLAHRSNKVVLQLFCFHETWAVSPSTDAGLNSAVLDRRTPGAAASVAPPARRRSRTHGRARRSFASTRLLAGDLLARGRTRARFPRRAGIQLGWREVPRGELSGSRQRRCSGRSPARRLPRALVEIVHTGTSSAPERVAPRGCGQGTARWADPPSGSADVTAGVVPRRSAHHLTGTSRSATWSVSRSRSSASCVIATTRVTRRSSLM